MCMDCMWFSTGTTLCENPIFDMTFGIVQCKNKWTTQQRKHKRWIKIYAGSLSFLSSFFFFGRCHLEICNEIIYFEREGGKKSYWKIWGDVSFNTDIKCTTQRQIITCKEPWWEEMPRYESQTAELLLFSSDKCWKVFFCLWKLNVKKWQHFWKSDSSEVVFFLFFFFLTRRESTWWKPDLS